MRNLKRALSLALAMVMVLSMMVIGAGAASYDDFSDKDEIVNKEAVNVLVELGVIEGKDTGAFDPTGIITRGEMAKIICVVLNKGQDPNLGAVNSNTYTDTVGHWAAPYIEYCTTLGIVAGKGDGTFAPNDTVTGSEAAKMLLVALGYNAQYENMIGANWAVATNVLANKNGLYDGLSIMVDEGLTRDNAAQMMYNALDAEVVWYDYAVIPDGDSVSAVTTAKSYDDNRTLLTDKFGAVKVEGVVVANEYAELGDANLDDDGIAHGDALKAGKTKIAITNDEELETLNDGKALFTDGVFEVASGAEALGRGVAIYAKPSTSSNRADKATVIGSVIISGDNNVVTDTSGDSINDVLDDNDLDADEDIAVYANYGAKLNAAVLKEDGDTDGTRVYAGVEKIVIDSDGDGDADVVLLNTYELGKVTKYSTKDDGSITVSAGTTFKSSDAADVVGFDDVARDDYVLAAYIGNKLYVEKAETVAGELTAYKTDSSLTVDDTKYDISKVPAYSDLAASYNYGGKTTLNMAATFYLDKAGRIIAVGDADESAYNYALVWGTEGTGSTISYGEVKVTLQDGTTKTYDISSKSDLKNPDVGSIVSYTLTSDDEIKMSAPAADYEGTAGTFAKGKTTVKISTGETGSYYASANTAFFYVTMDGTKVSSVDVYTGYTNAPSVESTEKVVVAENKSEKIVAVAFTDSDATAQAEDHVFVYKTGSTTDEYIEAYAYVNGKDENEIINVSDIPADDFTDLVVDRLYTYSVNSDGYYELDTVPAGAYISGMVQNSPKTTIVVGDEEYKLTDETVVIDNVGNPGTPDAIFNGAVSKGDTVMGVINADKEVLMLVIGFYGDETVVGETAAVNTIDEADIAEDGTVNIVIDDVVTTDNAAGLNDGTLANGMFAGMTANEGVKYTWIETRIPYTAEQYKAAHDEGGHAVWTHNPSYAGCSYASSFPGNVNDSHKEPGKLTNEEGGYIRMYTLVSSDLVESKDPTITFKIKFGTEDTFGTEGDDLVADLTITIDVSGITFN